MSAQQQFLDIIKNNKEITEEEGLKLFDGLEPTTTEFMIGEWSGGPVETGHMTSKWCRDVKFAGKTFNSEKDVQPVWVFDDQGSRVFSESNGYAQLREVKYRGVVTATLIYDEKPVLDHFRKIDDDHVIAAADNKNKSGTFLFYLKRGPKAY